MIPFVDLRAQYEAHRQEIDAAIGRVVSSFHFIGGPEVAAFEHEFAAAIGAEHVVACANGTDALYIAQRALGIGPGDEVITSACSWIATSETISQVGATPVFCDVDAHFSLDVQRLDALRTPRTRAVIAVHLYGQPADMEALSEYCRRNGLLLLEDCAQAHLARVNGRAVGTLGDAATFSFFPSKNLGAYGDAGCMVFRDSTVATRARMLANHGSLVKNQHEIEGVNSRLDAMQAAVLRAKLPHLAEWTRKRRSLAARYRSGLADVPGVELTPERPGTEPVYHLFVVQVERRDEVRSSLQADGIETFVHYPSPLPFLPAYAYLALSREQFPRAARTQPRILSLPMFAELGEDRVDAVIASLRRATASVR